MQSLFGHHGYLNLTTRLQHDIGIRQVGLKAVNAVGRHRFTPDDGVLAANVDRKGEDPWPAIPLEDQHPVRGDRQERQHSTAAQVKPALEGTRTQLTDLETETEGLEDPRKLSGRLERQFHHRIIRGFHGTPSWVVRIH